MAVLAIDAGTSSCKVGVFSVDGLLATAGREYSILTPQPGQAELDASDIWEKIKQSVKEAVSTAGAQAGRIEAISFSSMGETMVPVTADRKIIGPCILSYDNRGAEYSDKLLKDIGQENFQKINPNAIGPYFSMSKILWVKHHLPDIHKQADKYLLFADFIGFMLGAEPYAINSLANRTLLFDLKKNDWSDTLLDWSGFEREKLGKIVRGGTVVGTLDQTLGKELGLSGEVLLVAGGHDQCCNSLGCGCTKPGMAVAGLGTYETYCPAMSMPSDLDGYLAEVHNLEHHVVNDLYVSFLYNHSGLLVNWFRSVFAPELQKRDGKSVYDILNEEMPKEPTNILFLPHNEPLQWPLYDGKTSGVFVGLKTNTTRGDMFRAVLEGVTYYFVDAMSSLERMGLKPELFIASGGGSRSDAWMQIKADILGVPFQRLESGEGSLTGAATLAGLACGMFKDTDEARQALVKLGRVFSPDPEGQARYAEMAALYKQMDADLKPLQLKLAEK